MPLLENRPKARSCFLVVAALAAAALITTASAGASASTDNLPKATLLTDGGVSTYLLVFHTGQEVMSGLLDFARQHKLVAGHLTGIGAVSHAVIGYFDPGTKTYLRNQQNEQAELLSVTGNLALKDGEPFFHVHVALGLKDGSARGGHLFEAKVRPTVELVLTTYPKPILRKPDPETGLPLLAP